MMRNNLNTKRAVSAQSGGVYILRIATVLLAIVSWWATAQGMTEYIFREKWQANLASLAVQGILLGLNFYLPAFWRYLKSNYSKAGVILLTLVVLFCSSWFSYVYIAGRVYEEAWDTECQLLVQSTYRSELYKASDYAQEYGETLRDSLTEQIGSLYTRAKEQEGNGIQIAADLDLAQDRADYADNKAFAAHTEIASAIHVMEEAIQENAPASVRTQAAEVILSLEAQIDSRLALLKTQIQETTDSLHIAGQALQAAQGNLANAVGTDTEDLQKAVDDAQANYNALLAALLKQQGEQIDYQTAQGIMLRYGRYLGISSGEAGTRPSDTLRTIQSNLLQTDMDIAAIEQQAIGVFDYLQSTEDDAYQTLLADMDGFIHDVQDYGSIKAVKLVLDDLIHSLSDSGATVGSDPGEDWKTAWAGRLGELKAAIGSLPVYTGTERTLAGYDRTDSMDHLDESLRLYISGHNAADQAIIYLGSPYRSLALFSLLLAFFLDIAAFITGFVVDAVDRHRAEQKDSTDEDGNEPDDKLVTPATARRYLYLSGDFTKEDGRYYYRALDGENEIDVELPDQDLPMGFYAEESGKLSKPSSQALALDRTTSGPRDGVYQDCFLRYSDHMLTIKGAGEEDFSFLATMDGDVPVYRIRKNECVCEAVQDIPPQQWHTAILALNSKGTLVSAIYLE